MSYSCAIAGCPGTHKSKWELCLMRLAPSVPAPGTESALNILLDENKRLREELNIARLQRDATLCTEGPRSDSKVQFIPTPREAGNVVAICNYRGHVIVACEYGLLEFEHENPEEPSTLQYIRHDGPGRLVRFT